MEQENKSNKEQKPLKDVSKKKKILKCVLNVLLWGLIAGFVIYGGCKVIDVKSGYKFLPNHDAVIVSESMSFINDKNKEYLENVETEIGRIQKNDVIHTSNYKSFDDVQYLDVIIYMSDSGTLICHRVIDKYQSEGNNYIVTRGDANNIDDLPVRYDLVRGKVTSVTGGGGVVLFFQSPYFILALCGTGFFILLGALIFNLKTDKKEEAITVEGSIENKKVEPVKQPIIEEKPAESPAKPEHKEEKIEKKLEPEETKVEQKVEAQEPVVEDKKPERVNGRFVPKGGQQKKINWPPKNTRWTKDNNPSINKKRADGEQK